MSDKVEKKNYYKLTNYPKNLDNPFMEEAIENIQGHVTKKYKNATNTGEKAILNAVDDNGEVLGHTSFVRQIEVDEEQFAKIYLSQFSSFWGLCSQAIRVFGYIMTKMIPGQDKIIFLIHECQEHTKYKGTASIYIGLGNLIENGIIARGPADTIYYINPMIFFNGNRVTFAKTYVKKRKPPKIDPNQTNFLDQIEKVNENS